jgi:hypothetical protein
MEMFFCGSIDFVEFPAAREIEDSTELMELVVLLFCGGL